MFVRYRDCVKNDRTFPSVDSYILRSVVRTIGIGEMQLLLLSLMLSYPQQWHEHKGKPKQLLIVSPRLILRENLIFPQDVDGILLQRCERFKRGPGG